jgi:hypothetical protein
MFIAESRKVMRNMEGKADQQPDAIGRSRPHPLPSPDIIVDDENKIRHRHHRIAEGFASQPGGKS